MKTKITEYKDRLIYDKGTHRWSLDGETISKYVPEIVRYGDQIVLQEELDLQSELLYDWIFSNIPNSNIQFVEYLLAKDEKRCLKAIYEALLQILLSDLQNNISQGRLNLGINFKTGLGMDKKLLRESLITENVKMKIENIPGNIFTSRNLNIYLDENRYERWDY